MSCRIKSNKYFSQKVNIIRDKTDFLALHPYFWTKVLVRNSTSNISVSSCMWKRLHRSFGSFRFHRLDRFYRLQCFYRSFRFYRSFDFYFSICSIVQSYPSGISRSCRKAGTLMRLFYLWQSHSPMKYIPRICTHAWQFSTVHRHDFGALFLHPTNAHLHILRTTNWVSSNSQIIAEK